MDVAFGKRSRRVALAAIAAFSPPACDEAGGTDRDASEWLAAAPVSQLAVEAAAPARPAEQASVRWTPDPVPEGTLFTIVIEGGAPAAVAATGGFAGEPLHFARSGDGALAALAAAPLDSTGARTLEVTVTHEDGSTAERRLEITIAPGEYAMQRLTVPPQYAT